MWGGIIVHSIPWLVTGWVVIITSRVNRDTACFHTPIPSVDSYLICFFYTKFLQISGFKHPTGHWVEFSHSLGRGRFWPNWARSFWCAHSFLNSAEWLSRTSGDVNAQGALRSRFLSSDPGALDQAFANWDRRESHQEYQRERILKEGWKYQQRKDLRASVSALCAESSNLPRKSNSLQSIVHCRLMDVCYSTCQHTHLSALYLPTKSLGRVEEHHSLHKFH